jgi:hypothetical protein
MTWRTRFWLWWYGRQSYRIEPVTSAWLQDMRARREL